MTELPIYSLQTPGPAPDITDALLTEIAEHLADFAKSGEPHKIDLLSLPMSPADLENIDSRLGVGEVNAELMVVGRSRIWETTYAGVWRTKHFGTDDIVAVNEIEICFAPEILLCHRSDARDAAIRMRKDLSNKGSNLKETVQEKGKLHV